MQLNPLLLVHCHQSDYDSHQALQALLNQQSDLIFVHNHGFRLIHQALQQQILLFDRHPSPSQFSHQDYFNVGECLQQLATAGYQLVNCRAFQFKSEHWVGFLSNPQQIFCAQLKPMYSCPLIPLLKIQNMALPERVACAIRSILRFSPRVGVNSAQPAVA